MDEKKSIFRDQAMYFGLYVSIVLIISSLLRRAIGTEQDNEIISILIAFAFNIVNFLIVALGIYFSATTLKKKMPDSFIFPYKTAFGHGVLTIFFASIVMAAYSFVMNAYVDPETIDELLQASEEILKSYNFDKDIMDSQLSAQRAMMTPGFLAFSEMLSWTMQGVIASLVVSVFTRVEIHNFTNSDTNK